MRKRLFAAIAAVLFGAGAALAAAKPHIENVEPKEAFSGSVVRISGTNFSDAIAEVSVTAGGAACVVLAATPTELAVMLPPDLKRGSHAIEVAVAGEKSNKVEVTIRPEEERKEKAERDFEHAEGGNVSAPQKFLALDVPQASLERGTLVINVTGRADYPDGTVIDLELKLDNLFIRNTQARVEAKGFKGVFGPYDRMLFAGNYAVHASFQLMKQGGDIRRAFREAVKDPKKRAEMQQAHDQNFVRIGTPADEQFQTKELRGYFSQALARSRDLLKELETNYAAAGRTMFRDKDGKVNEEEWEKWLARRTLKGVEGDAFRKRAGEFKKIGTFTNRDGTFNDQAWREWLDFKWREGGVLRLIKDHVAFRDKYLVMKYHEEMLKLEDIFSMLVRLSQARSSDLYQGNGLPIAASDRPQSSPDLLKIGGGGMGPATPAAIELAAKKIGKSLGLDGGEGAGTPEKP